MSDVLTAKFETIKQELASFPGADLFQAVGDNVLILPKEHIVPVLKMLKAADHFDFLMDVCGVDYPEREKRFDVVYHLFSSKDSARLRIKVAVGDNETIDTATGVWKGAGLSVKPTICTASFLKVTPTCAES
jgi:NADH-quinone oxidoreductase subunit C/D